MTRDVFPKGADSAGSDGAWRRERLRSWWQTYEWFVVGLLAVAVLVLGVLGFRERATVLGEAQSLRDSTYLSFQLFLLESGGVTSPVPWTLEFARVVAPLLFGYAAARALVALFRDQIKAIGLRFLRGHLIVCGLGDKGISLVRSLSHTGTRIVIIERDAENDFIEPARERGALVLVGDARDDALLKRAGVSTASHIVAVCRDDSTNVEIAVRAMWLCEARKRDPLVGVIHVVDPELCSLLRTEELAMPSRAGFVLEFFNVFERGAAALLRNPATSPFMPPDGAAPHAVVIGPGRLATSLIAQMSRTRAHQRGSASSPLTITLVGPGADDARRLLESRHIGFENGDTRLKAVALEIASDEFEHAAFLDGPPHPSVVYVCVKPDPAAVSAGLAAQRSLRYGAASVVVRLTHGTGLGSLLGAGRSVGGGLGTLSPFGLLDETCHAGLLEGVYERMARELHEAYRRHSPAADSWESLNDRDRASSRAQAAHTGAKLRAVECGLVPLADASEGPFQFTPSEVELLARLEHDRWCVWMRQRGYRRGERRRDRGRWSRRLFPWLKSRHPYLRPWEELPADVQEANRQFIVGLPGVLGALDQHIVRLDDTIPRAIHLAYVRDRQAAGEIEVTNPAIRPWDELPETLKQSNRDQAAHMRIKLRGIGCDVEPAEGEGLGPGAFDFTSAELEALAQVEHDRWMEERIDGGWRYGPEKDVDQKLSPSLVPWSELDEGVKELDRDVVRHLPEMVSLAGYRIVRSGRVAHSR